MLLEGTHHFSVIGGSSDAEKISVLLGAVNYVPPNGNSADLTALDLRKEAGVADFGLLGGGPITAGSDDLPQ